MEPYETCAWAREDSSEDPTLGLCADEFELPHTEGQQVGA